MEKYDFALGRWGESEVSPYWPLGIIVMGDINKKFLVDTQP